MGIEKSKILPLQTTWKLVGSGEERCMDWHDRWFRRLLFSSPMKMKMHVFQFSVVVSPAQRGLAARRSGMKWGTVPSSTLLIPTRSYMVPTVPPSNIVKIRSRQFIRFMYIYIVKIRSKQFLTIYVFLFCLVKNRAGSEPLQKLDFLYSKKNWEVFGHLSA